MKEITVKFPAAPAASYSIFIEPGILRQTVARVQEFLPLRRLFVVTDANVAAAGHLQTLLASHSAPCYIVQPAGEVSKNMGVLEAILEAMEAAALGRDTVLLALGGGTIGDMAGLAAALFKRGVPVVHVPTTTVAQADSAIGGKTGVDSTMSKNAYGLFHHPAAVFVDVETLATLDAVQYSAGLAESVKHGLIADAEYFGYIEKNIDAIMARRIDVLEHMAVTNVRIKASIVESDPAEENLRRVLNYGHTVGHAVESASEYRLLHGQAVAIGMVAAAMIEIEMGLGDISRLRRLRSMLSRLQLPTAMPQDLDPERIMKIMTRDKKAVAGWPRFILLDSIGRVHCEKGQWAMAVPRQTVEKVLAALAG
ncbi:MAG TPA: 3-dehydroquinate synthase [Sedimentisphaerales bacterium]|nr:3-dehydroquinate synthase [Sedimentisphaerales bacterium]